MDTMEITKFVGAICGSLLVFLLIHLASGGIFSTASETVAYWLRRRSRGRPC